MYLMVRAASAGVSGKGQEVMANAMAVMQWPVPHGSAVLGVPLSFSGISVLSHFPLMS